MRILIVSGHTSGYNSFAKTGVNEGDLNIELAGMILEEIRKYSDVVALCYDYKRDLYRDLKNGVPEARLALEQADYVFEVHFNACSSHNARGTSIYLHESYTNNISVERNILDNLQLCGARLRGSNGINKSSTLLNMNVCHNIGVDYALIETAFYDNADDMRWYRENNHKIAKAIADGIATGFGFAGAEDNQGENPEPTSPEERKLFRVQVGAFADYKNALALQAELSGRGYDAIIKES